ncbi:uncharacterized protein PRCAT00005862001 [Priceomyces carsonii]|uniref:uncharacterized protein n=1 Tax=Priceomyces carsonii TaxID=28549 RepID=UPI002EDAE1D7|nr:unnamed protein product [Priceomyces carsonii]
MNRINIPPDYNSPPKYLPLQSFESKYQIISNLGNGSFGSVVLTKYRKDKRDLLKPDSSKRGTLIDPLDDSCCHVSSLVAIKTMNKKLHSLNDYTRVKEVKFILSIPSHPSLVQIYEMFIDDVNFQLHISMESMNQNLYQLMKSRKHVHFSPITLKSILTQILHGIRHIHKYEYFHRDVKPENILVIPTLQYYGGKGNIPPHRKMDNYVVKLADYGLARNIHNLKPYTAYVSTRWYRSPEILLRKKWYSKPVDIWAFGTVAVEAANFIPLFPGSNELDQTWRILKVLGSPVFPDSSLTQSPNYFGPLGGYWKEAQILAAKLGFSFPLEPGIHIYDILPNPSHNQLAEVVKACLTWNPDLRPDVEAVCSMPYFQNTEISTPYQEPSRASNHKQETPQLSQKENQLPVSIHPQSYENAIIQSTKANITLNNHSPRNNSENAPTNSLNMFRHQDANVQGKFTKSVSENLISHSSNIKIDEEQILAQNIDQLPSELKDGKEESFNYYDAEYSEKEDERRDEEDDDDEGEDEPVGYDSDQLGCEQNREYSWAINTNQNYDKPRNIDATHETLDDEFGVFADLSFGSGPEIKC